MVGVGGRNPFFQKGVSSPHDFPPCRPAMMIVYAAMGMALAAVAALIFYGGRRLARSYRAPEVAPLIDWPAVALLVPVKGNPAGMDLCLDSLLTQDYPDYEIIFITQEEHDAATPVLDAAMARALLPAKGFGRPRTCRRVVAGLATQCGQKNHNLLAGIAHLAPDRKILAFCDATHLAPPHWLRSLTMPIARGQSKAATGYHHCHPASTALARLAPLGRTICVLALYMMQEIPAITQPWGGAMAIERATFDELGVAEIWATNVVDDVSLAARLQSSGLKARAAVAARMESPLPSESFAGWQDWLARQWLYLKFIFPGSWAAIGLALYTLAALMLWAAGRCLAANLGLISWDAAYLDSLFLCLLALLGLVARTRHPDPIPAHSWLAAFLTAILFAAWTHMTTLFSMTIGWRGLTYRVGINGTVRKVLRD